MICIRYVFNLSGISIWANSLISISVSLIVGIPASILWAKSHGGAAPVPKNTTIYKD